jgi:hypothetical protein
VGGRQSWGWTTTFTDCGSRRPAVSASSAWSRRKVPVTRRSRREGELVAAHADEHRPTGPVEGADGLAGGRRVTGALQQHLWRARQVRDTGRPGVDDLGGPEVTGQGQPRGVDVGHHDLGGAEGPRHLHADQPDGAGAGDQHPGAGAHPALAAGPDADRQGFEQRRGVVADRLGHRVGEGGVDDDVLGEGPVDGRGREEPHVRAEVVAPGQALRAGQVRDPRFDRHPLPDGRRGDAGADGGHLACRLVPQHQRGLDDEPADPPVVVVVRVRPADPDRGDADHHLTRARLWHGSLLHHHVPGPAQDRGPHGGRRTEVPGPRGRPGRRAHLTAPSERPCTSLSWAAKPAASTGRDTTKAAAHIWARNSPWLVTNPVR